MKRHGRHRLIFVFLILCLCVVVVILSLELWAHLRYARGIQDAAHYNVETLSRQTSEAFHPHLWVKEWLEYRPNTTIRYSNTQAFYEVHINNIGFRGQDVTRANAPDVYTIACLGGSTTVNGQTDSTTYPAHLETFMNDGSPVQTRVINAGISGLVSSNYEHVIRNILNGVQPDMIIEYNAVNDIFRRLYAHWNEQRGFIARQLLKSRFVKDFLGDIFLPDRRTLQTDINEFIVDNLRATAAALKNRGVRFAVCSFIVPKPDEMTELQYTHLDFNMRYWYWGEYISFRDFSDIVDLYNQAIRDAFAETDVLVIPLAETGSYPVEWFVDASHMNAEGIRTKASRIAKLLKPKLQDILKQRAAANRDAKPDI